MCRDLLRGRCSIFAMSFQQSSTQLVLMTPCWFPVQDVLLNQLIILHPYVSFKDCPDFYWSGDLRNGHFALVQPTRQFWYNCLQIHILLGTLHCEFHIIVLLYYFSLYNIILFFIYNVYQLLLFILSTSVLDSCLLLQKISYVARWCVILRQITALVYSHIIIHALIMHDFSMSTFSESFII